MNDFNYSTTLTRCMLLSALALAIGVVFPIVPHVLAFAGALGPLIWYHVVFLRPRAAEGLNQTAIDSVYYYGFLITIGALGATALDLSLHGIGEDFAPVAFQFGLGLLATGYAVWARVHLTASAKVLDEDELREIMSRQIARSRELLGNVELASSSFESFAHTLLQRSEQFSADSEARTKAMVEAAVKAFTDGVTSLSEQARLALGDLRGIVNDVTFGAEREALRASVTGMVDNVASLSAGLDQLKASTTSGATSVGELAGGLERVNAAAGATGGRLEALGREGGSVAMLHDALLAGRQQAGELTSALGGAAAEMTGLWEKAAAGREAFELVGRKAALAASKVDKLSEALDGVSSARTEVDATAASLADLVRTSGGAAAQLASVQDTLSGLQAAVDRLSDGLAETGDRLGVSLAERGSALEAALGRLVAASDGATGRMSHVVEQEVRLNGADGASAAV